MTVISTSSRIPLVEVEIDDISKELEQQPEVPEFPLQLLGPPTDSLWGMYIFGSEYSSPLKKFLRRQPAKRYAVRYKLVQRRME